MPSKNQPLLITDLALERILSAFATQLGLSDPIANAAATTFLRDSPAAHRWDSWMGSNCARCAHDPVSCPFFFPEIRPEGVSVEAAAHARALVMERSQLTSCPNLQPIGAEE